VDAVPPNTEMKRDPRKDPQPGDIIRKGNKQRKVVTVYGNDIWYDVPGSTVRKLCWITTWRVWARGADVIQ
jgi:hypothetical protein